MFLLIVFLMISFHASSLNASGPWEAQVVDAETKQPLGGVRVLAVWYRYWPDVEPLGMLGYEDSEAVVTDKDGRFTVKSRSSSSDPFILAEPEFHLSKLGYGRWRFQGEEEASRLDVGDRRLQSETSWSRVDGRVVIELTPLKTRDEGLSFTGLPIELRSCP